MLKGNEYNAVIRGERGRLKDEGVSLGPPHESKQREAREREKEGMIPNETKSRVGLKQEWQGKGQQQGLRVRECAFHATNGSSSNSHASQSSSSERRKREGNDNNGGSSLALASNHFI